ncbi:MAG: DUF5309 family protein [Nitrospiraceae bacterium]
MAIFTGTGTRYDAQGLRESLADIISDISPEQTPFFSGAGTGPKARQTLVEWQTDTLAAAAANAVVEGNDSTFAVPSATKRVGNQTQISEKTLILSDTLEVVDKAGRKSELARLIAKFGKELKRDIEFISLSAQGGAGGSSTVARTVASLGAWLQTNTNFDATSGADPTYTSGVPLAARTDSSAQRAFTETILKDVISQGFTAGAEFSTLMVGPFNKTVVSGFAGIATRNFDLSNVSPRATAIIASADVYVSDFGTLRVIPNRFQRERDAWMLDWNMVSYSFLRPFQTRKLAKTGDAEKRLLNVEWTIRVENEAAHGIAADLTTS